MFPCFKHEGQSDPSSEDVVHEDLQSVLKPLNLMQAPFFLSKYTIRNNCIKPNSIIYNLMAVISMLIFRIVNVYKIVVFPFVTKVNSSVTLFLYVSQILDTVFYTVGFVLNNYLNIVYSRINIGLVLKLQFVHRVLNINRRNLKSLIIYNWIFVVSLYSYFIFIGIFSWITYPFITLYSYILVVSALSFDMNIVYALRLIKLLTQLLRFWLMEIQELRNLGVCRSDESYWMKMFDVFKNIVEAYKTIQDLFSLTV
ncbi:hypothetical protein B5X24_HaOG200707 [Helicoverpa armigera]|uniref:Gustatory receptor n=1 Tax=Helicoverpa armigera TaxID=29058 RepID=A0A2W1BQ07_HELAM|nr:hypothetical protein B5X24_HaOG200707 [Helicoverpa armigera]